MADLSKTMDLLLADGKIDETEVKVLKNAVYADGKVDRKECEFLVKLRNAAMKKSKKGLSPAFESFFFKAVKDYVLNNGIISKGEAAWLKKMLYADKKIDPGEKKFMGQLKKEATRPSPEFLKLYAQVMK
jgi:hypothetical protein